MRTSATARREAVVALAALMAVALEPAAVRLRLRSRDERGQAIDAGVVGRLHRRLRLILRLRLTVLAGLLRVALKGLLVALMIVARLLNRNEAGLRPEIRLVFAVVVARLFRRVGIDPRLLLGLALAELFLRSGNQAEIMLGMLIVVLGGHGIAG